MGTMIDDESMMMMMMMMVVVVMMMVDTRRDEEGYGDRILAFGSLYSLDLSSEKKRYHSKGEKCVFFGGGEVGPHHSLLCAEVDLLPLVFTRRASSASMESSLSSFFILLLLFIRAAYIKT